MKMVITIELDEKDFEMLEEIEKEDTNENDWVKEPLNVSQYARVFDCSCPGWTKNPEYNLTFLKHQQIYANQLLRARGRVFLNEIYDMLGFPKSSTGDVVGWVYYEDNPNGDNFINFGLDNIEEQRIRNFINGYTPNVVLDFNVDGNILDLI